MFSTDDIKSATLISIEPVENNFRGNRLKFSVPTMGGAKEIVMSEYDITYCETLNGEMIRRTALVVGETYNMEVFSYVYDGLRL